MRAEPGTPADQSAGIFRAATLPRWRAVFAIVCAAGAFLCAGGVLEYGTGSPETNGTAAAGYWAWVFAVYVAAFGGAGLIAAFPALARAPVKLGWLLCTLALYALAFTTWWNHQPAGANALREWLTRAPAYAAAAIVTLIGLALPFESTMDEDPPANERDAPPSEA